VTGCVRHVVVGPPKRILGRVASVSELGSVACFGTLDEAAGLSVANGLGDGSGADTGVVAEFSIGNDDILGNRISISI
jgi:hypothetical protein